MVSRAFAATLFLALGCFSAAEPIGDIQKAARALAEGVKNMADAAGQSRRLDEASCTKSSGPVMSDPAIAEAAKNPPDLEILCAASFVKNLKAMAKECKGVAAMKDAVTAMAPLAKMCSDPCVPAVGKMMKTPVFKLISAKPMDTPALVKEVCKADVLKMLKGVVADCKETTNPTFKTIASTLPSMYATCPTPKPTPAPTPAPVAASAYKRSTAGLAALLLSGIVL